MWSPESVVRAGPGTCSLSCLCHAGPCRKGFRNQGDKHPLFTMQTWWKQYARSLSTFMWWKRSHIWPLGHLAIGDRPAGTYILCRFLKVSMPTLNWLDTSRMHHCLFLLLKLQAACASLPVLKRSLFFLLTQSVPDKSGTHVALSSAEGHRMFSCSRRLSVIVSWESGTKDDPCC